MSLLPDALFHGMDFFRKSPFPYSGRGGHKEWLHFCVHGTDVAALINFSLVDEWQHAEQTWAEVARLTVLVREREWLGDVDRFHAEEISISGGRVDVKMGHNSLRFEDGLYKIHARLRAFPIDISLELEPLGPPGRAPNLHREDGPPIHWVVVPRLRARGVISVQGRRHRLEGAPAYHDHNWGFWSWGDDFAWEWGFGLDDHLRQPWHMVYVRLTNRARTRVLAQAVSLWKDGQLRKLFGSRQVRIWHEGLIQQERVPMFPRVMALLSPEMVTDVPRFQNITCRTRRDHLECRFEGHDVGQVILPNDNNLGVTIINEVSGQLQMRGEIDGEPVAMEGRAIFEFLGS